MDKITEIPKELVEWMWSKWRTSTHPKYYKYFEEWVSHMTDSQVYHYNRMMYNDKNHVLG